MRVASDASLSLKFMHYEKHDTREEVFLKICLIVEIDIIFFCLERDVIFYIAQISCTTWLRNYFNKNRSTILLMILTNFIKIFEY